MQLVYIPKERLKLLGDSKATLEKMCKACNCRLLLEDGEAVRIEGSAYDEFVARNVVYAFGRGFDVDTACRLSDSDYYFTAIDLEQVFGKREAHKAGQGQDNRRERQDKALHRAGERSQDKRVRQHCGFIGRVEDIKEAEAAVNTLIDGGTHRLAYEKMETEHRKNKRREERRVLINGEINADEIFKEFKEHSIAEFFKKNRQMLGYAGKVRSMTTIVHEYVTNGLDACEEAGILPDIDVNISQTGEDRYRIGVLDNGPGIPKNYIGKVLATDARRHEVPPLHAAEGPAGHRRRRLHDVRADHYGQAHIRKGLDRRGKGILLQSHR